jgi:transcription antitermination factor NusA-like protein
LRGRIFRNRHNRDIGDYIHQERLMSRQNPSNAFLSRETNLNPPGICIGKTGSFGATISRQIFREKRHIAAHSNGG